MRVVAGPLVSPGLAKIRMQTVKTDDFLEAIETCPYFRITTKHWQDDQIVKAIKVETLIVISCPIKSIEAGEHGMFGHFRQQRDFGARISTPQRPVERSCHQGVAN